MLYSCTHRPYGNSGRQRLNMFGKETYETLCIVAVVVRLLRCMQSRAAAENIGANWGTVCPGLDAT